MRKGSDDLTFRYKNFEITKATREPLANLTTETIKSASLSLQGIYDVERGDSLSLCVLGICDSITNNTL